MVLRSFRSQGDRPTSDRQFDLHKLGGVKARKSPWFTDVRGFTTIAETADPDVLLRQTSRYFAVLTEAFLAEAEPSTNSSTARRDGVLECTTCSPIMSPAHAARFLQQAAGERLNAEFEADGLEPFFTRFGIHVGEAVVRNVGSTERMNYGPREQRKSGSPPRRPQQAVWNRNPCK
jgi:adenylate cyclase